MNKTIVINLDTQEIHLFSAAKKENEMELAIAHAKSEGWDNYQIEEVNEKAIPTEIPQEVWIWNDETGAIEINPDAWKPNAVEAIAALQNLNADNKVSIFEAYQMMMTTLFENDPGFTVKVFLEIEGKNLPGVEIIRDILNNAKYPVPDF